MNDNENEITCPRCGQPAYEHLKSGQKHEMDTIGTHRVCSTEEGTFLHSYQQWSDNE